MTTPNAIITPQTANNALAITTSASTIYSDTPTITVPLLTAAVLTRVTRVQATQRSGNNTAMNLQLYLSKDAGVTKRLIGMRPVPVFAIAATAAMALYDFGFSDAAPLTLMVGDQLFVAQSFNMTGGFSWLAEWQEY